MNPYMVTDFDTSFDWKHLKCTPHTLVNHTLFRFHHVLGRAHGRKHRHGSASLFVGAFHRQARSTRRASFPFTESSAHQREATMETAATMKMVKALARSPEAAPHLIVQPGDIVSTCFIIFSMSAL